MADEKVNKVNKVVYGGMEIPIQNPRLSEALAKLDTNHDGVVGGDDWEKESPALPDALVDAFEQGGAFKYKTGREGFKKMLDVYPRLKGFTNKIAKLKTLMVNAPDDTGEMEFDKTTWEKMVKPLFRDFTPEQMSAMTWEVAEAITALSGGPGARETKWPKENYRRVFGDPPGVWSYNQCAVEDDLRVPIFRLAEAYNQFSQFLQDYREVECDGEGCSLFDIGAEISLRKVQRITLPIQPGSNSFLDIRVSRGGGCFTGDQFLKTAAGTMVAFGQFAAAGQTDGTLLSYNECVSAGSSDGISQRPTQVMVHQNLWVKLMHLKLKTSDGEVVKLKVTENHPLLVKKFGGERWTPAGELKDGDILLGPDGVTMSVDRTATQIEEGVFTLYNLSFSDPGLHPTYAVSPDGKHWVWAHNIK